MSLCGNKTNTASLTVTGLGTATYFRSNAKTWGSRSCPPFENLPSLPTTTFELGRIHHSTQWCYQQCLRIVPSPYTYRDERAVTVPRCEIRWNLQGCPKLANRSQPLVARSSPYYEDMWSRYRCLTSFFPIVNTCLSCKDTARQICAMVSKCDFCVLYLQRAACSTFQTCILNLH